MRLKHQLIGWSLLWCLSAHGQQFFNTNLAFGTYAVGFRTVEATDWTRPSLNLETVATAGREMKLHIWYPAAASNKQVLQYKDYLALGLPAVDKSQTGVKKFFMRSVAELSGDSSLFLSMFPQLMNAPMRAKSDIKPAAGKFPFIIYPDQPHLQSILCEYLASHGYIVLSPVIKGPYSHSMEYNLRGIESAVEDLQFTVGYARQQFRTERHFAVMGLGFNATNVLALQMRNSDVKAMISLEGGITTGFENGLLQRSPFYDVERCLASMLIIHAPHPDVDPAFTYKYKYAPRIYQRYQQSSEFYFLNFGIWERVLKNIFPKANKGNTWESFEIAATSVKHFLQWQLGENHKAKEALTQNKPGFVETTMMDASPLPPSPDELVSMIRQKGITTVEALYKERKRTDTQPFPFTHFFMVAQSLIQASQFNELKSWAFLYADSYPQSAIPYTLLGHAFLETNEQEKAKKWYQQALSLLDRDGNLNNEEKAAYHRAIQERLNSIR